MMIKVFLGKSMPYHLHGLDWALVRPRRATRQFLYRSTLSRSDNHCCWSELSAITIQPMITFSGWTCIGIMPCVKFQCQKACMLNYEYFSVQGSFS